MTSTYRSLKFGILVNSGTLLARGGQRATECAYAGSFVASTLLVPDWYCASDPRLAGRAGAMPVRHRRVDSRRIGGCEPASPGSGSPVVMMTRQAVVPCSSSYLAIWGGAFLPCTWERIPRSAIPDVIWNLGYDHYAVRAT